jgi:hypothetical protein
METYFWSPEQMFADTESHIKYKTGKKFIRCILTQYFRELAIKKDRQLPKSFDARTQWTNCSSVHHIANQAGMYVPIYYCI